MNLTDCPALPDPGETFTASVLTRVRRLRRRRRQQRLASTTLCALLLAAGGYHWMRSTPPADPRLASLRAGEHWLLSTQEADGSWKAESWGGHTRFTPGVTALATLALLENDPSPAATRAGAWLLARLDSPGHHLEEGPVLYNHLLSLHALVELQRLEPDPARTLRIQQALRHLLRLQQSDGGWGYVAEEPLGYSAARRARSNSAVTWWVRELLRASTDLLDGEITPALAKAERWLADCFETPNAVRYHPLGGGVSPETALYWMAAVWREDKSAEPAIPQRADFYRDYFRSQTLPGTATPKIGTQTPDGSWSANDDRWGRAGGNVYTTATALLALRKK